MDIREFLTARLDDDEQTARAAGSGEHWLLGPLRENGHLIASDLADEIAIASPASRHHIVRWDPARVLADVAAKRRILARHADPDHFCGASSEVEVTSFIGGEEVRHIFPCDTMLDLAASYADHPDFDPAWRVAA